MIYGVSGCLRIKVDMNSSAAGWLRKSETIIQVGIVLSPGDHSGSATYFIKDSTTEDDTGWSTLPGINLKSMTPPVMVNFDSHSRSILSCLRIINFLLRALYSTYRVITCHGLSSKSVWSHSCNKRSHAGGGSKNLLLGNRFLFSQLSGATW
jgi:hypothetical protein